MIPRLFKGLTKGLKGILIGIGTLAVIAIALYFNFTPEVDTTIPPTCNVNGTEMISLINQYRTNHSLTPYVKTQGLDNVAKDMSKLDAIHNTVDLTVGAITQAAQDTNYTNDAHLTFQVFTSTDATQNSAIFNEMVSPGSSYLAGIKSTTYTKIGVFTTCSTTLRTITIHADPNSSLSSLNDTQYKVYALIYLTYDE
jgi:hypothetical protein